MRTVVVPPEPLVLDPERLPLRVVLRAPARGYRPAEDRHYVLRATRSGGLLLNGDESANAALASLPPERRAS